MRRPLASATLIFALALAGCSKDFVLDPPHDSPRDPDNPAAPGAPPQPGALTVEGISSSSVTLRWTISDSTSVSAYRLYARGPDDADFRLRTASTIQRGTITGLQNGELYAFRVAAVNLTGLEGPFSGAVAARPASLYILIENNAEVTDNATVTVLSSAIGYDQVRLGDSPATLPSGYQNLTGAGTIDFTLTGGDGVKTLYAQFRVSASGAESQVVSDAIRLDRIAVIASVSHSGTPAPGSLMHFQLVAGETDGNAIVDIGTARPGIRLFDDGSGGDPTAGDGTYEANYVVERTFDAISAPVIGHFADRAGNVATPVEAPVLVTIANPPPQVTLVGAVPQGRGRVLLQWSASGAADFLSYRVWHAPSTPVLASPSRILDSTVTVRTATTVVTDSLPVGVARLFVVEVVDLAGNATASNELAATPTASQPAGSAAGPMADRSRAGIAADITRRARSTRP